MRVTGSGRGSAPAGLRRHPERRVRRSRRRRVVHAASTRGSSSSRTACTLPKFQILDEHGEPLRPGRARPCTRARSAPSTSPSTPTTSSSSTTSSATCGVETRRSRSPASCAGRKSSATCGSRRRASRSTRSSQLFYDPYSVEALPDVVSAERTGRSRRQRARRRPRRAAEGGDDGARRRRGTRRRPKRRRRAQAARSRRSSWTSRSSIPDNLVLRGKKLRPGGPTGAALGDVNITVGGDLQVPRRPNGPVIAARHGRNGARHLRVPGPPLRSACAAARCGSLGEPQINPAPRRHRDARRSRTPASRRASTSPARAKAPQLDADAARRRSRSPTSSSLIVFNRPVNELGTGERASLAATAGGIATGFIAAPLGESIGRALDLDLFEITTTTDDGRARRRPHASASRSATGRSSSCASSSASAASPSSCSNTSSPSSCACRHRRARNERLRQPHRPAPHRARGIDLIFFFSY